MPIREKAEKGAFKFKFQMGKEAGKMSGEHHRTSVKCVPLQKDHTCPNYKPRILSLIFVGSFGNHNAYFNFKLDFFQ